MKLFFFVLDDSANGMWSDDGSPYLPNGYGGHCSGCFCSSSSYGVILKSCTNTVYVLFISVLYLTVNNPNRHNKTKSVNTRIVLFWSSMHTCICLY